MIIRQAVEKLEKSRIFKSFAGKNKEYYLVHAFAMITGSAEDWQLGYYNKEKDKVVVFEMGDAIKQAPEEDVLKDNKVVLKLDLKTVKLEPEEALRKVQDSMTKKYGKESVTKSILILQNLEGKSVYNITLVTSSFDIVNCKISAETGRVLESSKKSIISLGSVMK